MGLKQDLIDAKVKAAKETGMTQPLDTSNGSFIEREAHYIREAIVKFITEAEFRVTQFNAPIVLEEFRIPPQQGDVLPGVKSQGVGYGGTPVTSNTTLLGGQKGVLTKEVNVSKFGGPDKTGNLVATGYSFIGKDPDSQLQFDVDDRYGQREFTTVKCFIDDLLEQDLL
tara:strand:- start:90 stop:596 length:507 start_codon:yes stop_codon:yes gene_type:complete